MPVVIPQSDAVDDYIVRTYNDPRVHGRHAKLGSIVVFVDPATGGAHVLNKQGDGEKDWGARTRELTLDVATAAPAAAPADTVRLQAVDTGGRDMAAWIDSDGVVNRVQAFLGRRFQCKASALAGTNNHDVIGMSSWTIAPGGVSRALSTSNLLSSMRRMGVTSSALAGSTISVRHPVLQFVRGTSADIGGFHAVWRWAITDAVLVPTARMLVGFLGTTSAPADGNPSALANILAVGCDDGDTTMQLYAAGVGAQSRINLGADFPVNTTGIDVYEFSLYCPPGAAEVRYSLTRLNTGHRKDGVITEAARLPAASQFLAPHFHRSNGVTAAAVSIDWTSFYAEIVN